MALQIMMVALGCALGVLLVFFWAKGLTRNLGPVMGFLGQL